MDVSGVADPLPNAVVKGRLRQTKVDGGTISIDIRNDHLNHRKMI